MLWVLKRRLSAEDKSSLAGKELKREKQVFPGTYNVISIKSFNVGRSLYSCYQLPNILDLHSLSNFLVYFLKGEIK